jgi:hypothetical protein
MDLQEDFRLRLLPKLAVVVPEWLRPHQGCIKAGDVGHAVPGHAEQRHEMACHAPGCGVLAGAELT